MADEHFIPGTSRITEIESFHRYYAAADLCRKCKVLDAASGDGYGSAILASRAQSVTGIDLNKEAVMEASRKYFNVNLEFVHGDVAAMPFADNSFDRVVSFETIEHIPDQKKFLSEVRRVLKPEGVLILSSPNKTPFRTRNKGQNDWHITELESDALLELLEGFFSKIRVYAQDAFYNSIITGGSGNGYYVKNQQNRIVRQDTLSQVQYSIVIASEVEAPVLPASTFLDASFDPERGYVLDDEAVVNQFGLRGEFERAYKEREELRQLSQGFGEEKNAMQETISLLQQNNEELLRKNNEQLQQNGEMAKVIASVSQAVDALRLTNESLNCQLQARAGDIDRYREEVGNQQYTNQQLSEKSLALEEAVEGYKKELENQQYSNQQLSEKSLALEEAVEGYKKELENQQYSNQQLSEKSQALEEAVEGYKKELENQQHLNQQLNEKSQTLEETVEGYKKELENQQLLNQQLSEKSLALEETVEGYKKELENQQYTNQKLSLENSELKRGIEHMQETNQKLTGEIAETQKQLQALKSQIEELKNEIAQQKNELDEANSVIASRDAENAGLAEEVESLKLSWVEGYETALRQGKELSELHAALAARESEIGALQSQWNEEHAKSEYLYHENIDLKNSLSFRLLGRWKIRRKTKHLLCSTARTLMRALPLNYSKRMDLKDKYYSRYGSTLTNDPAYKIWRLHYDRLKAIELESDTGLIMPETIPLTSIIIPVYNNIELTRRCIHSIYKIKSRSPFEIIVVDDCSPSDDYKTLLSDFPEVRLIRNEKNSGFLLTVNRGAKEAKGEYILILNNDTEVVPGWLDELTCAMSKHPEAGMIGSQLIHLGTGTLQESGNLICKNGDMLPLGRGESPDHPQFNYFREVDFVSAASIILRKKVFVDEMDGFDRIYVPAYFEDPDLGLRLKQKGYKNYVCPLSRVLHQEMASYGDALDDKCARNRAVFMDRWRDYLAENALYADREEPKQCLKFPKPRIMYIDAEFPMADRGSGGMDAIFFMEYMIKRGYDVVFHGEYTPGIVPKYTSILLRMGVECVCQPQRKIWEYLPAAGWSFSYIFVSRIYQARCFDWLLKLHCPQAGYIFDTVDVHFVREQLEADLKNDDTLRKLAADTKKYELAAAEAADATIVISSDEKKLLENEYHLTNVYHIPQARELFGLAPNPNRRGAVFIGSAHPPNLDGLRHFHDDILPLLPKDFKLTIIGEALKMMIGKSDEYKDLLKCPQFNFVGFVQDLGTELNNAKITIAPLRYGAGTKGKVASSMSYGVPCVSSAFGTEGTGMVHNENIMIAKTPEEFADYIQQLFNDEVLWKKISDGGIKFIKDNYAPETVEKMMDLLFDDVTRRMREQRSNWSTTPVMPKMD